MIQIVMPMPEKCSDCIFCDDNCSCVASDYNGIGINVGCAYRTGRRDIRCPLKEQEERKGNYVPCKVKTPAGKWDGEKCSVCGTEYIGSAPLKWKFCPDCGAKMEGR